MSDSKMVAAYLRKYNAWRRGGDERMMHEAGIVPAEVGRMLDAAVELLEGHAQGYADPVGEITTYPHVGVKFYENTDFGTALTAGTELYTHPPKAQAVPEWIECSERLPEQLNREYLVRVNSQIHSRPRMFVAEYDEYGFDRSKVTHWMPLPQPPQEGSGDA